MTMHDLILVAAAAFLAFLGVKATSSRKADAARLARLEEKVSLLLSQAELGTDAQFQPTASSTPNTFASVTASPDVVDLVRRGRKIEAIKVYRERNPGTDLKQAKDAVEQIERSSAS